MSGVDCDDALRDVEAYLDGELPAERARVIELHLADCSPCLDRAEFQRALLLAVRSKCGGRIEAPETLGERVRRLIGPSAGA